MIDSRNWKLLFLNIDNQITILNMMYTIVIQTSLLEDHVRTKFVSSKKRMSLFIFTGERTAVRLQGDHRIHDYINANEIKVIREE